MRICSRAKNMSPSARMSLAARAREMKSDGIDVISLATGEPDFDTPEYIKAAAIDALKQGVTKYTPAPGVPELRQAIADKLNRENDLNYTPDQITVTTGAKQAIYNALAVLCDPGDEVIVPAPYWVSYVDQVKLVDAEPVVVECGPDSVYKLTVDQLKNSLTDKTKAILLNSPNNPTGAVYSRSELEQIGEIATKAGVFIISDEVYEYLVFDGNEHVATATVTDPDYVITVNGMSKGFAMTGWRMGYAAGPSDVIKAMTMLQSHVTSHITSFVQQAAIVGLNGPRDEVKAMVAEFDNRRKIAVERLNAIPGIECSVPAGAFYVFPRVTGLYGETIGGKKIASSIDVADVLLNEAHIAVVPGEAFGSKGNFRLSYALATDRLQEALERMSKLICE